MKLRYPFFRTSKILWCFLWVLIKEKHASRTVEVHYRLSHSLPEWCRSYQSAAGCRLWFEEWLVSRVVHELRNEKIMKIQKSAHVLLNRTPKNYGRHACQGSFAKLHLPRSAGGTKKAKNTRRLQLCGEGKREEIWENIWVHDHRQRTGSNADLEEQLSLFPRPQAPRVWFRRNTSSTRVSASTRSQTKLLASQNYVVYTDETGKGIKKTESWKI